MKNILHVAKMHARNPTYLAGHNLTEIAQFTKEQ